MHTPDNDLLSTLENGEANAKWLHRFAFMTACSTFALIFVGALVKSHEAGLSVPDWPTTYGEFMLSFPPAKWVGNIFYEHGHRLAATAVGFFTTILAIWLQRSLVSKALKILGWVTFVCVCIQGYLGGLTVKYLLPVSISTGHSMLAQGVLCMTTAIAMFTSKRWSTIEPQMQTASIDLRRLSIWTVGAVGLQIMLGAIMRHLNAALAIPTFPLANGALIPEFTSIGVVFNFAHRVGAIVASGCIVTTIVVVLKYYRDEPLIARPAMFAMFAILLQVSLGALTIWSARAVTPATLHVSGGSLVLVTMFTLALRAQRVLLPRAVTSTSRRVAATVAVEPVKMEIA